MTADGATSVFIHGRVQTLVPGAPPAEAVAVRAGRILATGAAADVRARAGGDARVVDLGGATVLPGLIDTHPHLMHFGAFAEPLVDIADARSHDDVVERIRARAAETPAGEWVMATPVGEPHYFLRRSRPSRSTRARRGRASCGRCRGGRAPPC